jgi:hypothetical protein
MVGVGEWLRLCSCGLEVCGGGLEWGWGWVSELGWGGGVLFMGACDRR